jgi:hypothetical protein
LEAASEGLEVDVEAEVEAEVVAEVTVAVPERSVAAVVLLPEGLELEAAGREAVLEFEAGTAGPVVVFEPPSVWT